MTYLSDFCTVLRRWIDEEPEAYSDEEVTEWVRDGEERINNELRVPQMVYRTYATFDDDCAQLPGDYLELIYVRLKGGRPFDYITPHDYWEKKSEPIWSYSPQPDPTGSEVYPTPGKKTLYTIIGSTLFVYPAIDPAAMTQIEICYYRALEPLGDKANGVFTRYPSIYRYCALTASAPYLQEDERINSWASLATAGIQHANDAAKAARWSGSPLPQMIRGFG